MVSDTQITQITHLDLRTPLYYAPEERSDPFAGAAPSREMLYCFELDDEEAGSFEPDKSRLLDRLAFAGASCEAAAGEGEARLELPAGSYLFAQKRELLCRDDILEMAVEIQQEGLWRRLKPEKKLFLRCLFEDDSWVTQLFRPFSSN